MKRKQHLIRLGALFLVSLGVSCAGIKPSPPVVTIVPPRVEDSQISWDGNEQNGGLIDYVEGKGFEITKKALIRYQALVFIYGANMVPPVKSDDGVTIEGERIFLSSEAMVNFMTLNKKFKNGGK